MTTSRQIEANQRNARKSTGPRTPAGKETAKMNSVKHGLSAEEIVLPSENPEQYDHLHEDLISEFKPLGALEHHLVDRIAGCTWRLRRLYRVEAGVYGLASIRLELSQNLEEMRKYEEMLPNIPHYSYKQLRINDKQKHGKASAQVERTTKVLRGMSNSLGAAFVFDAENVSALSKLSRYEAAIERSLYRALHELQRVQAARQDGQQPASIAVDVTVDGPQPSA